jgi:hypothetical protein
MLHRKASKQLDAGQGLTIGESSEFSFVPELLTAKEVAASNRLLGVATDASS